MTTLELENSEIEFLKQLFDTDIAVSIKHVEMLAGLRRKIASVAALAQSPSSAAAS